MIKKNDQADLFDTIVLTRDKYLLTQDEKKRHL